jgi:Response regulators consisting of a CheY-like receiver domain and a winged-helix DNA-binding domain
MLIDNHALLDPDRRQLILDGTRADLTKLEFDVLQYLHEREGRVVGRAALLRDVVGLRLERRQQRRRGRDQRPPPQAW